MCTYTYTFVRTHLMFCVFVYFYLCNFICHKIVLYIKQSVRNTVQAGDQAGVLSLLRLFAFCLHARAQLHTALEWGVGIVLTTPPVTEYRVGAQTMEACT